MQVLTSKEVADMLGKRHDNLLRDIRKYIATLGGEAYNYFAEDPQKGAKLYLVSKAGCDLMAGRITGEKSVAFKAKYIPIFEGSEEPKKEVQEAEVEPEPVVNEYPVDEVAKLLGISERSVYRNIQAGKLEAIEREIMIPTVKKFVTEEALEAYKTERRIQ